MTNNIYTVGQVNAYIKNMFAQDFLLRRISVSGEVSNCKYHSSGHVYFTLKDSDSVLQAVMFSSARTTGLRFPMKVGDKVIVTGSVHVYERDGKYQIYANQISLAGAGLLYQRFEELKRQLEDMGMFAKDYKKPIPSHAKRIGIVTAATGAAIKDIQNVAQRRNPYVQLILYPAKVQGEGAAETIVEGIAALDAYGVDVIIVGRGGGSMEDLWAFNEEIVARAIFDCSTPIISAVGHETDTTIADYVADMRAPTPSAAAELAVFNVRRLLQDLDAAKLQLNRKMGNRLDNARERANHYERLLQLSSPKHRLEEQMQRLTDCQEHLTQRMEQLLLSRRHQLQLLAAALEGQSPLKALQGGYAYLSDEAGNRISSVKSISKEERFLAYLSDGSFVARVEEVRDTK